MWVPPTSVGFRLPAPVALSHFVRLKALTLQARVKLKLNYCNAWTEPRRD